MSNEEIKQYNKPIIAQMWGAIFGGAMAICGTMIWGVVSIRDEVKNHEYRISQVEKQNERQETQLLQLLTEKK